MGANVLSLETTEMGRMSRRFGGIGIGRDGAGEIPDAMTVT